MIPPDPFQRLDAHTVGALHAAQTWDGGVMFTSRIRNGVFGRATAYPSGLDQTIQACLLAAVQEADDMALDQVFREAEALAPPITHRPRSAAASAFSRRPVTRR